ncbi:MAG TPA: sigma-70 family RNA polymerase sigma factor [Pseudonocardiaceae bacterium]|jgi:RNA polymerase sigma factor (sigma-70 family)|nr:sigma-70 family RNA polymerase sigma factor [Pseudonocardiaceae bacterium]
MSAAPVDHAGPSDAELIAAVRAGDADAYGTLYERHVSAARNLARTLSRSTADVDDLVAESFARVLEILRAGRGPEDAFRAYLLTSVRNVAYDRSRRDRKLDRTEDVTEHDPGIPFTDPAVADLEKSLVAKAFAGLPERWRAVIWHCDIEGESTSDMAGIFGMTASGVASLHARAREGLREAYVQAHIAEVPEPACRLNAGRLGAWVRGGLTPKHSRQVAAHLDECESCRSLVTELADVNASLRAIIAPLVLGAGVAGYLALTPGAAHAAVPALSAWTAKLSGTLSSALRGKMLVGSTALVGIGALAFVAAVLSGHPGAPPAASGMVSEPTSSSTPPSAPPRSSGPVAPPAPLPSLTTPPPMPTVIPATTAPARIVVPVAAKPPVTRRPVPVPPPASPPPPKVSTPPPPASPPPVSTPPSKPVPVVPPIIVSPPVTPPVSTPPCPPPPCCCPTQHKHHDKCWHKHDHDHGYWHD